MEELKQCMFRNKVFSHPALEILQNEKNNEYITTCISIFDKLINTDFNIPFNELLKITATEYHNFAGEDFGIPRHNSFWNIIGPGKNISVDKPFVPGITSLNKDHIVNLFNIFKFKSPYVHKKYSYYSQFFDYSNPNYLCTKLNTDCGYEFPITNESIKIDFPQESADVITTYKKLSEENKIKFVCCVKTNNINLSSFWTIIPKNSNIQNILNEVKHYQQYAYSRLNLDPNISVYILHTSPTHFNYILNEIDNLYNMLEKDNPNNLNIIAQIYWWLSQAMFYMRGSATISDIICRALLYKYNNMLLSRPVDDRIPDLEAIITPNPDEFINVYKSMFKITFLKCKIQSQSRQSNNIPLIKHIVKSKSKQSKFKRRFGIINKKVYPVYFDNNYKKFYYNS